MQWQISNLKSKMAIDGCGFALPIEVPPEEQSEEPEEESILLTVDSDGKKYQVKAPSKKKSKKKKTKRKPSRLRQLWFTWRMIRLHILLFLVLFGSLYAGFHYGFDALQKKIILQAVSLLDDWKQLMFFFGIYLSFAVKKTGDVSSVS